MVTVNKKDILRLIGERIKRARKIRGLSQRSLAKQVGLSATSISKYERGLMAPGSQIIIKISQACRLNPDFFLRPPGELKLSPVEYRAHKGLPKKQKAALFEKVRFWLESYLEIEDILGEHLSYEPYIREIRSLEEVEAVAQDLRARWNLGLAPIANLVALLEDKGIKIVLFKMPEQCSAFTFKANDIPVMAGNARFPGDRLRFSLAHELGHLVLNVKGLDEEKACHRFAGAFLIPKEVAIEELRQGLSLSDLIHLKSKYGLSIQAWIYRAKDLGLLSEAKAQGLFKRLRVQGWHKKEPGPKYPKEKPLRFKRLVCRALEQEFISPFRAKELLGLPSIKDLPCK